MSAQTVRWGMAFTATATLSAALVLSAARAPAPIADAATVAKRDPSTVSEIELELILNKIREGDLLSQKNDAAGAARAWQEARRLGEGLWPIHVGLGDSFVRAKRYDDALDEYRIAASLVPDKYAGLRGTIAAKKAATLSAARRMLEAIQAYLDLNQPSDFGNRIGTLALAADRAAAVALIERHAEVFDARLFRLVAQLQVAMEHPAEAAQALAKFAIRVSPWDERVNREAVEGLRKARKFEEGVDVCRAWVRAVPQSIHAYELMGDLLWDSGREREALIAYSSIVGVRPGDAAASLKLGDVYLRRNRPDEALAQFERGLKASPQDANLRNRMIPAYLDQLAKLKSEGRRDDAQALRRKLAELNVPEAGLYDLKVVMTWDVMSDVDLDVVEPDGVKINHQFNQSKLGGKYFADNTKGLGPETYTVAHLKPGTWRVGAHLHSGVKSTVKFIVLLYEDTPREERREETITIEKTGETTTFIKDIVIAP